MQEISADFKTLLKQAPMTASNYLAEAIREIDERLGDGYAAKHPELISAFMATAARDHQTSMMAQQIRAGLQEAAQAIGSSLEHAAAERGM